MRILEHKEQTIIESKKELNKILPELIKRQKIAIEKQEARIFVGKEGIKSILEDILKTRKDFVGFGAEGQFKNIFKWYFDNWQMRRIKFGLRYKILYSTRLKGRAPSETQKLADVRFLPEKYEFPATTVVYGSKVAIIIWDINPISFVLESKQVVKSFLSYFDLLWSIGKK